MDFRTVDGNLDLGSVSDVWLEYELNPVAGILTKDGDLCYFNAHSESSAHNPLYLFSFVDEEIIQDMKNSRVDLRTGFSHHSALIFKEFENNGEIEVCEVSYSELLDEELPEDEAYLN